MNSLEVKIIPYTGNNFTLMQDYSVVISYPLYMNGGAFGVHDIKLLLKAGGILEIYSASKEGGAAAVVTEQVTPPSLEEQLSKLPFKEQNALYKLMNTWGCRMER